jgi:hypothetical protein
MKTEQFKKLKVGDTVYLKNTFNNEYTMTEVLEIDRLFMKLKVLLGRKFYSYRYISVDQKPYSCAVGINKAYVNNLVTPADIRAWRFNGML